MDVYVSVGRSEGVGIHEGAFDYPLVRSTLPLKIFQKGLA